MKVMQKMFARIAAFNKNLHRSVFMGLVIFGAFALFAQLTSPYDIRIQSPEEKLLAHQKELGKLYSEAKPEGKMGQDFLDTSREVYCGVFGLACDDNFDTFSAEHFDKSTVGKIGSLIATPFTNPPALGTYYVIHTLDEANLIPESYAAEGLGFAGLAPFLQIWKKLRDLAFLLIALVMIVSGFMIMFRTKMDPHSAIKLESALPKVIIAMILINFSFAIAGFLVDLMYIITGLIIVTFGPLVSPTLSLSSLLDRYVSPAPFDLINLGIGNFEGTLIGLLKSLWSLVYDLPHALLGMFGEAIRSILMLLSASILTSMLYYKIGRFFLDLSTSGSMPGIGLLIVAIVMLFLIEPMFKIAGALPILVLGIIILATVGYVMLQLLLMAFRAYIKILFYVMLAPLLLIMEAMPGSNVFIPWMQTIFIELMTFPLMIAILLLSGAFRNAISNGQLLSLPFITSINPDNLGIIVGFGILFMMPELIRTFKEKFSPPGMALPSFTSIFFKGTTEPLSAAWKARSGLATAGAVWGAKGISGKLKAFGKSVSSPTSHN